MSPKAKKPSKDNQPHKVKQSKAKKEKLIITKKDNSNLLLGKKIKRNNEDSHTGDSSTQYKPPSEQISQSNQISENKNQIYFESQYKQKYFKLKKIFAKYGKIKFLKITKKGQGLVEFSSKASAQSVIRDKSDILENYKLNVSYQKNKGNEYEEKTTENEIIELKEDEDDIAEKTELKKEESNAAGENNMEDNDITTQIDRNKGKKEENEEIIIEPSNKEKNEEIHKNDSDVLAKIKTLETKIENLETNYQADKKKLMKMIGVLTEINYQNEKYIQCNLNVKLENLNTKFDLLINSYKILFIRKLANIFLSEIYDRYHDSFKKIYYKRKKKSHTITVCINDHKGVDRGLINLITDFLKHIKVRASSIIHIQDKKVPFQKEILFAFLDRDNRDKNEINKEVNVSSEEAVGIIFEKKEKKKEVGSKKKTNFYKNMKTFILNKIKENEEGTKDEKKTDSDGEEDDNYAQNDEKKDEERIKRLISGDESQIKTSLSSQLNRLLKKIKLNREIVQSDKKLKEMENIDGNFFFNSWVESFDNENCKLHHTFQSYFDKRRIPSLANLGYYLKLLLKGCNFNIYMEEPKKLDKKFNEDE